MQEFLADRGEAASGRDQLRSCAVTYLQVIFLGSQTSPVGLRNSRELRTLAEIIDALVQGDLNRVGDLAMQRFKAVEQASQDGRWEVARHLEVIPPQDLGSSTMAEREAATRAEARRLKLANALEKHTKKMRGDG